MVTRNMRLSAVLEDIARRADVWFVLSWQDLFEGARGAQELALGEPVRRRNGVMEMTVDQPDGRGHIDLFARTKEEACLCARLFTSNSRFLSPAGIDDEGAGEMYHRMDARLDQGTRVRLAVVNSGCVLSVGGGESAEQWLLMNRVPPELVSGSFQARVSSEHVKVSGLRFVAQ